MKRQEIPILAAVFLDLLGFGMIIIDIQFRAKAFGASGWIIGALLASTFVTQVIVSPKWGVLSDRRGRKPVLLICTLISGIAMLTYGAATSLWWLLASRIVAGFGAANVAVAQAMISDGSDHSNRTAAMGRVSAAISMGLIAGPVLSATLAELGYASAIGYVAGGCSLLGALWIGLAVPQQPAKPHEPKVKRPAFDFTLLKDHPGLRPLVAVAVVAWFSLATLEGTFGQLIKKTLDFDQVEFGWIFGYESFLSVLVQGVLLVWISRKLRDGPLLRFAYLFQGFGLAITPFAPGLAILVAASTFYALGAGVANPTINSLASKLTPATRQGELFGLMQSARSIGFVVGPIVGGLLFDWYYAAPYLLAGTVCVIAAATLVLPTTAISE